MRLLARCEIVAHISEARVHDPKHARWGRELPAYGFKCGIADMAFPMMLSFSCYSCYRHLGTARAVRCGAVAVEGGRVRLSACRAHVSTGL